MARENAGLPLIRADLLSCFRDGSLDMVVSNPPYLDPAEKGRPPELGYEPPGALFAADAGRAVLRALIRGARRVLVRGGSLLVEHGEDQGPFARQVAEETGFGKISTGSDLAGRDRYLCACAPGSA